MNKLSKREKTLLYLLCVLILAAAGWFFIKPAMEDGLALDEAIMEAQTRQSMMEQTVATRAIYEESVKESVARIDALGKEFLPAMNNDALDRYITGLLQQNGLVAESLLISGSEDETASPAVYRLFIKITATGELPQFTALVEQVSKLSGIRISTFIVQQAGLVTKLVPLTEAEIDALRAEAEAAGKKYVEPEEPPEKEVTYMQYGIELGFEAVECDAQVLRALIG